MGAFHVSPAEKRLSVQWLSQIRLQCPPLWSVDDVPTERSAPSASSLATVPNKSTWCSRDSFKSIGSSVQEAVPRTGKGSSPRGVPCLFRTVCGRHTPFTLGGHNCIGEGA